MIDPATGENIEQKQFGDQLLAQAKTVPSSPGRLLSALTKQVLETALDAGLTEHRARGHGETSFGTDMPSGTMTKTALAEIGPVEIEDPGTGTARSKR